MELPVRIVQNAFTAGEWSPRLRGRSDMRDYYNSAYRIKNMLVSTLGGLVSRPGTQFAGEGKNPEDKIRLIPFRFNVEQNYVIELGNFYARFYRARGQVTDGSITVTNITAASPGVVTATSHGLSNGDQVLIDGVVGMEEINGRMLTVANAATNTFEIIDTSGFTAYSSGGTLYPVYEITTPWGIADVFDLVFKQSADVLYLTHEGYVPQQISRTSDTSWSIADYESGDGPYLDQNTSAVTMNPSGTSGSITITASSATFVSTDVGRKIRIFSGSQWGYATITAYTSSTQVSATVNSSFGATGAVTTWRLGAWGDTTGYPRTVTLFQQRLVFGGNRNQPSTVWGSKSNDYTDHAPSETDGTVLSSNGFVFTIADNQVNAIRWMSPGETLLLIGTSDASHKAYGGNSAGALVAITPANIAVGLATSYGNAKSVRVKRVGSMLFALQNSRRVLRGLQYNARVAAYEGKNSSIKAEHLLRGGISDFDLQEEIDTIGWMVNDDGLLIGFTYEDQEEINAYHQHALGGSGIVESIAVIPSPIETEKNDVWLSVKRTVNGTVRRYIEYMGPMFDPDTQYQDEAFYVDSGLTYNGFLSGTLTPGAITGAGVTFTASSGVFSSSDVGLKLLHIEDGVIKGRALITGYTSANVVTATVEVDFESLSPIASGSWALAKKAFSGFGHLEGFTVQALVDGADHPDKTVINGIVTLDDFFGKVHIGLGFDSEVISMSPEDPRAGTIRGSVEKVSDVKVRVYKSASFEMGIFGKRLYEVSQRDFSDIMDRAPNNYTGFVKLPGSSGFGTDQQIHLRQSRPLHFQPLLLQYNAMVRD